MSEHADKKLSNAFVTSAAVSAQERQTALRYRCEGIPTNKFKVNNTCPFCDSKDGANHTLMSCKFSPLDNMRTERHKSCARSYFLAVAQGKRGNAMKMVDVGSKLKRNGTALAHIPSSIPESIIPLTKRQQKKYKPDALMVIRCDPKADGAYDMAHDTVVLLEFKFCADTFYVKQLHERTHHTQHDELVTLLQQHGWKNVVTHHIRTGVGGTIFKSALQLLFHLGVSKKHARATMKTIHMTSIKHLTSMINTRQHYYKHNLRPH